MVNKRNGRRDGGTKEMETPKVQSTEKARQDYRRLNNKLSRTR